MEFGLEFLLIIPGLIIGFWMMTIKPKNFPPGPPRWPFFGYIPLITNRGPLYHILTGIQKKYGDVAGLYALNNPLILISGTEATLEAFCLEELSGRHEKIRIVDKTHGILSASGEKWKLQRRFTLHHLRDLGFGKRSIESVIHEEVQTLFHEVEELSGGHLKGFPYPVDFVDLLKKATTEVLWQMVTGKRYSNDDIEFKKHLKYVQNAINCNVQEIYFYNAFPWLAKIMNYLFGFADFESYINKIREYIQNEIDSHKEVIDYEHPRDFMDIYLCEIEKQREGLHDIFNETHMKQVCTEIFMAGTDTTSNTLSFAVLYMIMYPEAQKKVQQELDGVVGKDRLPSLTDRDSLPYIQATIEEVLRLSSVTPQTFPHAPLTTKKYIEFRGYHIPKDSIVIFNLFGNHHDPKIWKYPESFIPERFFQKSRKDHEIINPFGGGKRACPGETMARNNIFLFFTAILQRYTLKVPDEFPKPSQEPEGLTVLQPKPFTIKIELRS